MSDGVRRVAAVMVAVACAGPLCGSPAARTLSTARAAHDLPEAEASQAYPVHLRATVTYYDPYIDTRHGALFVCDSTGCIFVRMPRLAESALHAGDVVQIDGVTEAGDYAPVIRPSRFQVVSHGRLPRGAVKTAVPQVLSGSVDGRWVEMEGVVHSVHLSEHNYTVEIATIQGGITATSVRRPGEDYASLTDALIRIRGNVAPQFNRKLQVIGGHLYFPSLETVKILRAAPAESFGIPVQPVAEILQFTPGVALAHRVRVQGRVTLQWPGRLLCIQQARDGMCVHPDEASLAPVGGLVDMIGFPEIRDFKPTLVDVSFGRVEQGDLPLVEPRLLAPSDALTGNYDGELVQMEGELLGQDRATGDLTLMLRFGKFLIPAILPHDSGPSSSAWKDGSRLQVTGICNALVSTNRTNQGEGGVRVDSVQILLRSANDIRILATPSWWTPRNGLAVLAVVAVFAVGAFTWVIVLRKRVEQQTEALRRSEEQLRHMSQHDSLTGLPNRVLMNDRLAMALRRMERFDGLLGLLMIDLDGFKAVNDTLGHHTGDQVLCEVARRICRLVRQTDTVARLGGDEFIVLLPDLHDGEQAERIAAMVIAAIVEPIELGGECINISASVGVCLAPRSGGEAEALMQSVDQAMYRAKARGKNCYQVDSPAGNLQPSSGRVRP